MNKNQDINESLETFKKTLKRIIALEESLCRQEKVKQLYADYYPEPQAPPPYQNRASLAMITLSGTWMIFDVFAYFSGHQKLAIGASIFTVMLIIACVVLRVRGNKAFQRLTGEYEAYRRIHEQLLRLDALGQETKRNLEQMYEGSEIYTRYRNLDTVSAICNYLEQKEGMGLIGADSVYHYLDKEMQKGNVPKRRKEIEQGMKIDADSEKWISDFCDEMESQKSEPDFSEV